MYDLHLHRWKNYMQIKIMLSQRQRFKYSTESHGFSIQSLEFQSNIGTFPKELKNCTTPVLKKGECCPVCLGKISKNKKKILDHLNMNFQDYHRRDSCFDPATKKEYPSGSQWNRDVCTQCTCIQG